MSKLKLTYAGGKYAGKKLIDIVKSLKKNLKAKKKISTETKKSKIFSSLMRRKKTAQAKKSKANIERAGRGTKSIKAYNIRAGARNDKMVPQHLGDLIWIDFKKYHYLLFIRKKKH